MKLKKVKVLLVALLVLVSALSINLCAFATEEEDDFVIEEITTQSTTSAPTTEADEPTTKAPTTNKPTTTKKPTEYF